MAFRDKFLKVLEQNGGHGSDNVAQVIETAREVVTDFSPAYFRLLLSGQPPRPEDIQALAVGLGISPRHFLDDEQATRLQQFEEVSRFMSERLNRSDLADSFAEYVTKKRDFGMKI